MPDPLRKSLRFINEVSLMTDFRQYNLMIEKCGSTNQLVQRLGELGLPHGTWIASRSQTNGRGRLGRRWISELGNLFFSMLLRDFPENLLSWIPLHFSVKTCEVLMELAPRLPIRIKWPNDLWLNGKKVGGILCEGFHSHTPYHFGVCGLGLNCAKWKNPKLPEATTLFDYSQDDQFSPDNLLIPLVDSWQRKISKDEIERTKAFYAHHSLLQAGTKILWKTMNAPDTLDSLDSDTSGESLSLWNVAHVVGLGHHGELQVKLPDQKIISLYSEEVKVIT